MEDFPGKYLCFLSYSFLTRIRHGSRRKHRYLQGKSSIAAHDVFNSFKTPALKVFCTQSSHGQIGKQTSPAEPWTLKTIGYC